MNSQLDILRQEYKNYPWFADACMIENRVVVYVHYMNNDVFNMIKPDVLVHFDLFKTSNKDKYVDQLYEEEANLEDLQKSLDKLEKMCGSNTLQHIFYEVHDKHNAITNLSTKYPEVREEVKNLYDKYGFDVIYDELDD